jgi:hypothetical protein
MVVLLRVQFNYCSYLLERLNLSGNMLTLILPWDNFCFWKFIFIVTAGKKKHDKAH